MSSAITAGYTVKKDDRWYGNADDGAWVATLDTALIVASREEAECLQELWGGDIIIVILELREVL